VSTLPIYPFGMDDNANGGAMNEMTTGQRVARARKRRGWTQAQLAQETGRSVSWVAKIERGHAALDRRSVLDALARTLRVEVVELTGQPYRPETPATDSGHSGIPALRLALQRVAMPSFAAIDRPPRPMRAVVADLSRLERLRQAAKFTPVGEELPGLIEDLLILQREGSDGDRDAVASLMVRACHIARVMANLTGHHDLAWNALERELANADAFGAPVEKAAATWDLCGAWLHAGALEEARNAALTGLDQLEGHVDTGDAELKALWGALHLRAAVAYGRLWSAHDARHHVDEARRVVPATGNVWQTQFNAPNLAIHEVEIAVELGRPADTVAAAARVPVEAIDSGERLSHFWVCHARGLGMNGQNADSLAALLEAERVAGPHVLNRPMARELVADLLGRARRGINPDLRRMAGLMGVD
jgi:DNA-binding XRE family transcriptional regulator